MDQTQDQHPPMQGDDELAKALQGGLQFEETPVAGANATNVAPTLTPAASTSMPDPIDPTADAALLADLPSLTDSPVAQAQPAGGDEPPVIHHTHTKTTPATDDKQDEPDAKEDQSPTKKSSSGGDLDKLKSSALEELRPLVSKLNLPAEEKFDTLLLIIRSTDDQTLLSEAHDAAKHIDDDTKRAQALLDIIKEIDYFSTKR